MPEVRFPTPVSFRDTADASGLNSQSLDRENGRGRGRA
jgi:hypothetical protein